MPPPDMEAKLNALHKLTRQGRGTTGAWLLLVNVPKHAKATPGTQSHGCPGLGRCPQAHRSCLLPTRPWGTWHLLLLGLPATTVSPGSSREEGGQPEGTVTHIASDFRLRPGHEGEGTRLSPPGTELPTRGPGGSNTAPALSGGLRPH